MINIHINKSTNVIICANGYMCVEKILGQGNHKYNYLVLSSGGEIGWEDGGGMVSSYILSEKEVLKPPAL